MFCLLKKNPERNVTLLIYTIQEHKHVIFSLSPYVVDLKKGKGKDTLAMFIISSSSLFYPSHLSFVT